MEPYPSVGGCGLNALFASLTRRPGSFCSSPVAGCLSRWNAFKRLAAGYSADEKAKLFSGTAKRVYRLA